MFIFKKFNLKNDLLSTITVISGLILLYFFLTIGGNSSIEKKINKVFNVEGAQIVHRVSLGNKNIVFFENNKDFGYIVLKSLPVGRFSYEGGTMDSKDKKIIPFTVDTLNSSNTSSSYSFIYGYDKNNHVKNAKGKNSLEINFSKSGDGKLFIAYTKDKNLDFTNNVILLDSNNKDITSKYIK